MIFLGFTILICLASINHNLIEKFLAVCFLIYTVDWSPAWLAEGEFLFCFDLIFMQLFLISFSFLV